MATHDELAYAVVLTAIGQIRRREQPWDAIFPADVFITSSHDWPVPDFVIASTAGGRFSAAAEFKPPDQSKREYLTGLGQAIAYTKGFDYGLLVLPETADDNYRISDHVVSVLAQQSLADVPLAVLTYDPAALDPRRADFRVTRMPMLRAAPPDDRAHIGGSFYAKWREMSPNELAVFLRYLYAEMTEPSSDEGTIRDRAFNRLWDDIQAGQLLHWGGGVRRYQAADKLAVFKNYRNFLLHIQWADAYGRLTPEGLRALHVLYLYGADSVIFLNTLARSLLLAGKHLVFINAINEFQDENAPFESEQEWLASLEEHLENEGLLKRNPGRAEVAERGQRRGFLKAEKQLWRNLDLVIPSGARGGRSYHADRGFIFHWTRITELVQAP